MSELMCRADGTVEYLPSSNQVIFVDALFADDVRGIKQLAEKKTGVSASCFSVWWKDENFRKWYSGKCDEYLKESETIAAGALMEKVKDGDVSAIKTFYELVGKLRNPVKETGPQSITNVYNLWANIKRHGRFNEFDTVAEAEGKDATADVGGNNPRIPA